MLVIMGIMGVLMGPSKVKAPQMSIAEAEEIINKRNTEIAKQIAEKKAEVDKQLKGRKPSDYIHTKIKKKLKENKVR